MNRKTYIKVSINKLQDSVHNIHLNQTAKINDKVISKLKNFHLYKTFFQS